MSPNLYGIHDAGGEYLMGGKSGWVVISEAIGHDRADMSGIDYRNMQEHGARVIVRLNNAHNGVDGTIPAPAHYADFAQRCANFAESSRGVTAYVIGNEPNHIQERPQGELITPAMYADCFNRCYAAIKNTVGLQGSDVDVLLAPVAPWDASTKYPVNPEGDWVQYWRDILLLVPQCDGLVLHTYTHGAGPHLITSEARMDAPFQRYHYEFRAYRDFLAVAPPSKRHLPVYITETDQVQPWEDVNTGWVQAAYAEIDAWNRMEDTQKIMCLCLYRWANHDQWSFADKQGVHNDFQAAIGRGYQSPPVSGANQMQHTTFIPAAPNESPAVAAPDLPPRDITEDFRRRVPTITLVEPTQGSYYYRLIRAEYVPDGARRFGPDHHILVDVLGVDGKREMGTSVNFYWADDMKIDRVNKVSEPYGADYAMSSHGHGFGVWVGDFRQNSDDVFGMGLGTIEQPDWNHHVSYYLVFQRTAIAAVVQPAPPAVTPTPAQPPTATVPPLRHPIADPTLRVISQRFGENPANYAKWGMAGHNGVDFAVPNGTHVLAVDQGQMIEVGMDEDGYGIYVKVRHAWGESLYAHLLERFPTRGDAVYKGQWIGNSGNSGNSTGPHLHFGMRVNPYTRGAPFDGYVDPEPYLEGTHKPTGRQAITAAIRAAAQEFGVDSDLLLSQAWAESSFNPYAVSDAGAQGLFQIMPATWAEWGPKVGASDPFNVTDSARVGAAYMQWLIDVLKGNEYNAVVAYNAGIGNVLNGATINPVTYEYADKVIFGQGLLKAVVA